MTLKSARFQDSRLAAAIICLSAMNAAYAASVDPDQADDLITEEGGSAWDAAGESSAEAWDKTKDASSDVWEATKESSAEAWEATKTFSSKAWEGTKAFTIDTWESTSEWFNESDEDPIDEDEAGETDAAI